jgi:hypothetical protein
MAKRKIRRGKAPVPMGAQEVDIETFIAGIDNAYQAGEFDEEIEAEHELAPSKDEEGRRKEDTIYDVLLNVFHDAASNWSARSKDTGVPSKFFITIQPSAQPQGKYIGSICMALHFSCMGRGQRVCEKHYGLVTMQDLHKDDWKVSLVQEMITELFGITSIFIQTKWRVSHSDVVKYQVKKGEAKRKDKKD